MRKLYLAIVSILYASAAIAQESAPLPLSLQDCMDYAMKHNYTIKNAQLDVLIQKAQYNETLSAAYPHINGKAEFDDYINPPVSFFPNTLLSGFPGFTNIPQEGFTAVPFTPKYAASTTLTGQQVLFDGAVLVALKAKNTVLELAKQTGEVTAETVRYNITRAYNSLVIAYRQYDIVKNSLSYARSLEHDITETQKEGFAEKIEVERTSVQVNNLSTDSVRISNLLTVSEQMLKYQLGMDINTPIILSDTNIEMRRNQALALLSENEEYTRVPEYNLYETQLTLNEYSLKRYRLAALPTLNVFANAGYSYSANQFNVFFDHKNYIASSLAGIQLNLPIFNGLIRKNQVTEASLNVEKSKNSIEYIKQTIDFQAAQSRTSLRNAILESQSQHRNLDLANDVLDLAKRKYKAGVGSNLEVTQAQTDQLAAQNNYFNALLDLINSEADLEKALGLLK